MKKNMLIFGTCAIVAATALLILRHQGDDETRPSDQMSAAEEAIVSQPVQVASDKGHAAGRKSSVGHSSSSFQGGKGSYKMRQSQTVKTARPEEGTFQVKEPTARQKSKTAVRPPAPEFMEKFLEVAARVNDLAKNPKMDNGGAAEEENERPAFDGMSPDTIADAIASMANAEEENQRMDMLDVIDALLHDAAYFDTLPEEAAQKLKNAMADAVAASLKDESAEVRIRSVDTLENLPKDASAALYSSSMSGEHNDVKEKILLNHAGSNDFSDLAMFFHALDDASPAISKLAHENVQRILERDFDSSEKAFEWWESQF